MSPKPLQLVLLVAVAVSQIFGGISCCCLGRSLFGQASSVGEGTVREAGSESVPVAASLPTSGCPKCALRATRQLTASKQSSGKADHFPKLCEDDECRCVKVTNNASPPNDPPSSNDVSLTWAVPIKDTVPSRVPIALGSRKFEIPVRFGGHSWQSIACVWKN
jgi:hypothetical protein